MSGDDDLDPGYAGFRMIEKNEKIQKLEETNQQLLRQKTEMESTLATAGTRIKNLNNEKEMLENSVQILQNEKMELKQLLAVTTAKLNEKEAEVIALNNRDMKGLKEFLLLHGDDLKQRVEPDSALRQLLNLFEAQKKAEKGASGVGNGNDQESKSGEQKQDGQAPSATKNSDAKDLISENAKQILDFEKSIEMCPEADSVGSSATNNSGPVAPLKGNVSRCGPNKEEEAIPKKRAKKE